MDTSLYIATAFALAVVAGLGLVATIYVTDAPPVRLRGRFRARPLGKLASDKGFQFARRYGSPVESFPLDLLRPDARPHCQNVISSKSAGKELLVFELSTYGPSGTDSYTCALARMSANCPMLKFGPRDPEESAEEEKEDEPLLIPVRTEDSEFDAAFWIAARDPNVASTVLSPTIRRWLLERPRRWEWEVHDAFVVAWTPELLPPAEAVEALGLIRGFVDQLAADAERAYPPGPTELDDVVESSVADFRSGKIAGDEALTRLQSAHAAADSLADRARYTRAITEVTAARVDAELKRLARGTEL
jgi:hypothetical protein